MRRDAAAKKIEICHGRNCRDYGGKALAAKLEQCGILFGVVECRSLCPHAPVVFVDGKLRLRLVAEDLF